MLLKKAVSIKEVYDKFRGKEEKKFPWAAAAGTPFAALASYLLLRKGGGSPSKAIKSLMKGISPSQKLETSMGVVSPAIAEGIPNLARKPLDWLYRQAHGVDKLHYDDLLGGYMKAKTKNPLLLNLSEDPMGWINPETFKFEVPISASKYFGVPAQRMHYDKVKESLFLDKLKKSLGKDLIPETTTFLKAKKLKGKNKQKFIINELQKAVKGKENFFIKPSGGSAYGVGGESFLNKKDVLNYLQKGIKPKDTEKRSLLSHVLKYPEEYLLQKDVGISKDPIMNRLKQYFPSVSPNREFRIHVMGDKVIPYAGSVRSGGNIADSFKIREMEKLIQKQYLDKFPQWAKKETKDVAQSIDLAMTPSGPKIIELNPGVFSSGLANPKFQYEKGGVGGLLGALNAARINAATYKHLTSRHTPMVSGLGALGTAGVAAPTLGTID